MKVLPSKLEFVAEIRDKVVDMMVETVVRIQDSKGRMYFLDASETLYRAIPLKGGRKPTSHSSK